MCIRVETNSEDLILKDFTHWIGVDTDIFITSRHSRKEVLTPSHECRPSAEALCWLRVTQQSGFPKHTHSLPHENLSQTGFQYVAFLKGCSAGEKTVRRNTASYMGYQISSFREKRLNKETNEIKDTPDIYPNLLDIKKKVFLYWSVCVCVCVCVCVSVFSLSVVFDSLQPHGL